MGSQRFLTRAQLDLMFNIGFLNRYMEKSSSKHPTSTKRVLRYLNGTLNYSMRYKKGDYFEREGFCDIDFRGDSDDRKSTSGTLFF